LLNPNRREKNLRLKSEVILQFRSEELAVMKKLYWGGSISEVDYLRSVAARDIAAFNFKATQSGDQTQRKIQAIKAAKSRYDVAQKEFEIASQLFRSRAISQSTLDRAISNLKIASAELQASKQSLGARAVQVKQ
jgi:multidrug resistance efflux pump